MATCGYLSKFTPAGSNASRDYNSGRRMKTVLFADRDNGQLIEDILQTLEYEGVRADTGEEVLAAIARRPPHLILLDAAIPAPDGSSLVRKIKDDPRLFTIPIVALANMATKDAPAKFLAEGFDDCLLKPFTLPELVRMLSRYLD